MGLDVYTPAYNRMCETAEWQAIQARSREWFSRPTVQAQEETPADWKDFEEIQSIAGRMEIEVGHFRHRSPFTSQVIAGVDNTRGMFELTTEQTAEYLKEWRAYLLSQWQIGKHEEKWVNGFDEPVQNPFQQAVRRFKKWCRVYRLGEGCYVG